MKNLSSIINTTEVILYLEKRGGEGGGGALPYISHIGICRPIGYRFQAFLVCNRIDFVVLVWDSMITTDICRRGQCMANRKQIREENVNKENKRPEQNRSNTCRDN